MFVTAILLLQYSSIILQVIFKILKNPKTLTRVALYSRLTELSNGTNPNTLRDILPPKLYLVVFLSSEPGELDKDNLFGLQNTFGITSGKCLLYYITCSYPMGEL